MGKDAKTWLKGQREERERLPLQERRALAKIRSEARESGAILANNGKGGLPPSLVLGVLRRDGFRCKIHGDAGEGDRGGLTVHHKGHVRAPTSEWLSSKGRSNAMNNIVTICAGGHDDIHRADDSLADRFDNDQENG